MNEFKGTKGKWNLRGNFKALEIFSSYRAICAIARQSSIDSNIDSQAEANAKLIECAPEMLELLIKIKKQIDNSDEWWMDCPNKGGFDLEEIKSLIKKATQ